VVNRSGSFDSEISLKRAEETLRLPISWQIPNGAKAFQAARIKGVPLAEVAKGCRPHHVFLEIARSLRPAGTDPSAKPRRGLFAAFF
jgi:pilus assembly protein CpaE